MPFKGAFLRGFSGAAMLAVGVVIGAGDAVAHERYYVFNQEYKTLPKGGMELEGEVRFNLPDHENYGRNTWTYISEVEYGAADRFTLGHSEIWKTENHSGDSKDSTQYRGFEFEAKYRIGEKGKYWVDPLLYLEWKTDPQEEDHPNALEGKVVLGKDWDRLNVVYNHVFESELGAGGRTEHQWTTGVSYEIFSECRLGAEAAGDYWAPSHNRNGISLGPTVAYAAAHFWVSLGTVFGLNHAADDWEARLIVGVPIV